MISFICSIILVACLASFLVSLLIKWGFVEYMQVHGNDFFAKLFSCFFCMSFWANVVVALGFFAFTFDPAFLFVPFFGTTITRRLL